MHIPICAGPVILIIERISRAEIGLGMIVVLQVGYLTWSSETSGGG